MLNFDRINLYLTKLYYYIQVPFLNRYALPPFQAFIDVTYRCNLRCDMCHSLALIECSNTSENKNKELTFDQVVDIANLFSRNTLISFTGGEPFLREDMTDILTAAGKRHKCHVITNGTLVNEKIATSLMGLRCRSILSPGLFMIGFSIEGPEEIHDEIVVKKGAFQKAISAIKFIQEQKKKLNTPYPMIHLTAVITKRNAACLDFVYSLSKDMGLDFCNFVLENRSEFSRSHEVNDFSELYQSPPEPSKIDPGLLRSQLDKLEKFSAENSRPKIRFSPGRISKEEIIKYYSTGLDHRDYRCFAPWAKIGFSAFGDVYGCPHIKIGNVLGNDHDSLWNSPPYKTFRDKLKKEKSFPRCPACCMSEYVGR